MQAIGVGATNGQWALTMEGIHAICDTLNYSDYDSTLNIMTTLSRNLENLKKLKEYLDVEHKFSTKLKEEVARLETDKSWLLHQNGDSEAASKTNMNDLNEEIGMLKEDMESSRLKIAAQSRLGYQEVDPFVADM